ncbi:MAG: peptidoglycan bridge formation glycyltransferase FemA/FemB family protein [Micrococcaceae bacterium]
MFIVKKLSPTDFDQIVKEHPDVYVPIEQSYLWDKVDDLMEIPRTVEGLYGYFKGENLIATARLVTFKARMRNMTLVNQGPIWFTNCTQELEQELIETMIKQFRNSTLYLRMQVNHEQEAAVPALEQFMYDRAIWVDLTPNEDDLMMKFSSTTRRRIRQAVKKGVTVHKIDATEAPKLMKDKMLPILRETTERNDFTARSDDTYISMLKGLPENVGLYVAYVEDRPVCWLMSTEYNGHSQYPYAAGNKEGRDTYASFLLQWEVMKDMKANGNKVWDMTGVATDAFPQFKNVTQFKRGFSKNEVELPMHYDVPTSANKYKIITSALNLKRKLR